MPDQGPPYGYGQVYMNIAQYPELGLFRRFGSYWAKKLHDDTCVVLDRLEDVNKQIKDRPALGENGILDCPLVIVQEKYPRGSDNNDNLWDAWEEFDKALLQYGQTLCMSGQIMNLPSQDAFHTKYFLEEFKPPHYKDIFEGDKFVPTKEDAETYKNRSGREDVCAWTSLPRTDFLTMCFVRYGQWIEKHILRRLRRLPLLRKWMDPADLVAIRHDKIVTAMDVLTSLVASALLTASVLALTWLGPLRVRVAIVGLFGTLFALLVKLLGGNVGRAEIFTATAAYFAVAVVFVNSTTVQCAGR